MKHVVVMAVLLLFVVPVSGQQRGAGWEKEVPARTDTTHLSLEDALKRARSESEEVGLARAQVELAETQIKGTRAQALPQISGNLGYTRTFASQFESGGFTLPDSLRFQPDSLALLEDRVRYLERAAPLAGLGALGTLFGDLPFGQEHTYTAFVSGSQLLYSGGRVGAAMDVAENFRDAARLQEQEATAALELDVERAYYNAKLAQELESIAQAAVEQAEEFLAQERLRERAGTTSELDVLRAEVSVSNLRAQQVAARNAAELAMLDLRRLVNLPADQPVALTTELEVPSEAERAPIVIPEGWIEESPAVQAAMRTVRMRELNVRINRGNFLPSVTLQMNFGKTGFPVRAFDTNADWRTDWTAGIQVEVPIFDGFRRSAQVEEAQVQLTQSRLQFVQLRESLQMQQQQALGERQRAAASIAAREQTVTQAQRVYDLTVLRYERGLATQLEVNDARLALLQARTNLAQAVSDFHIAEATVVRTLGGSVAAARILNR